MTDQADLRRDEGERGRMHFDETHLSPDHHGPDSHASKHHLPDIEKLIITKFVRGRDGGLVPIDPSTGKERE